MSTTEAAYMSTTEAAYMSTTEAAYMSTTEAAYMSITIRKHAHQTQQRMQLAWTPQPSIPLHEHHNMHAHHGSRCRKPYLGTNAGEPGNAQQFTAQ